MKIKKSAIKNEYHLGIFFSMFNTNTYYELDL